MLEVGRNRAVGVIGATSLVGKYVLSLATQAGWRVTACSRKDVDQADRSVVWKQLLRNTMNTASDVHPLIPFWICVAPIWILPEYFEMFETYGVRRVVALSSTSRFTKTDSSSVAENALALRLAAGEIALKDWAESNGVEYVILRPTLIYGLGQDKNISEIARFVRRFRFFPLLGKAEGLRQPVHAEDVAGVCVAAISTPIMAKNEYNIPGGETLTYREMVSRVFRAVGRKPVFLTVPLSAFRLALGCLHMFPHYQHWSVSMAERMNRDLVFDKSGAVGDLGFSPRPFALSDKDVSV